jgi:hypothetical protein
MPRTHSARVRGGGLTLRSSGFSAEYGATVMERNFHVESMASTLYTTVDTVEEKV